MPRAADADVERPTGARALARGLDILALLAEAEEPLSATAIAERVGVSVSTASRALAALLRAGYVRKPDYRSFAVDYGILTLGASARGNFPLADRALAPLRAIAAQRQDMLASLAMLHGSRLIYLARVQHAQEPILLHVGHWPLHLSSVALLLLLERPRREALAALAASRRRYGWERPTPAAPASPADALAEAADAVDDGILALVGVQQAAWISAAAAVRLPGQPPLALALSGPTPRDIGAVTAATRAGARSIEAALAGGPGEGT